MMLSISRKLVSLRKISSCLALLLLSGTVLCSSSKGFGATIWTEDFSTGVGMLDSTLGAGATRFPHSTASGGIIDGQFQRGQFARRAADDVGTFTQESDTFGFRAVFQPDSSNVSASIGYIGYFGDATKTFKNSVLVAFHDSGTTSNLAYVRIWDADENLLDGSSSAIAFTPGASHYVRADWLPDVGPNGTWQAVFATGNYDDMGGTVLGTSSISPASPFSFSVSELGLGSHDSGSQLFNGNLHEISFVQTVPPVPEPSTFLLLGLAGLTGCLRRRKRRNRE